MLDDSANVPGVVPEGAEPDGQPRGGDAWRKGRQNLDKTDDKILDSTVGKTPVMVLQEHCHKHVGKLPTYFDSLDTTSTNACPVYRVVAQVALYTVYDANPVYLPYIVYSI